MWLRNGLDLTRFPSGAVPLDGPPSIVGVGYLVPAKRWERLLTVAANLKRQGVHCRVQIAGDGPLLPALTQQARDLDVADCVAFLGHVDDIPQLLKDATFLVHRGK